MLFHSVCMLMISLSCTYGGVLKYKFHTESIHVTNLSSIFHEYLYEKIIRYELLLHSCADIQNLCISIHFNTDQQWNEVMSSILFLYYLKHVLIYWRLNIHSLSKTIWSDQSCVYPKKWSHEIIEEENKLVKFKNRDSCNASLTTDNIEKGTFLGRYPSVGPGCIKGDIKCLSRTPYADLSIKLTLWKKEITKPLTGPLHYRFLYLISDPRKFACHFETLLLNA
jgi:hypothetical protein